MTLFRWPCPWSARTTARTIRRRPNRPRATLRLETLETRTLFSVNALSLAANGLVSDTAAGNVQGPGSVSSNGRYVVYTSSAANLAPNQVMDSKSAANVFLFDRATGQTTLVSHRARINAADSAYLNTTATGTSKNAVISADGNWIAFISNSDDLISGATLADDTYTLTIGGYSGGTFTLSYGGHTTNGLAYNASATDVQTALAGLSGIGTGNVSVTGGNGEPYTITFTGSLANGSSSPLTANGSGLTGGGFLGGSFVFLGGHNEFLCDQYNVYLYQVSTGAITLVSHVAADQGSGYQTTLSEGSSGILTGAEGGDTSLASQTTSVSISGDGNSVVYLSTGAHLVDGQEPGTVNVTNPPLGTRANVFVYDQATGANFLVSREDGSPTNSAGDATTPGDNTSYVAVINQNGDTIAFTNQSVNLVHGQTINSDYGDIQGETPQFFVAKRSSSTWGSVTMALASHDLSGAASESITNTNGPLDYPAPVLSPDGHWMVYMTDNAIVQNPISGTNAGQGDNYYLYDTTHPDSVSNNTLITHTPGDTTQVGNAGPDTFLTTTAPSAAISDNGKYVAFYSAATDLTSTATSAGYNVFLFNRDATDTSHNVTLITNKSIPTKDFPATTYPPLTVSISGDGRYVAYVGFATADISGLSNVNTLPGSMGLDALLYDQGSNPGTSTATYTLLSHKYGDATTTGTGEAYSPLINEDGNAVFYLDDSTNLIQNVNGCAGQDLNAALPTDGTDLYAYSLTTPSGYTPQAANGSNATVTLRDPSLPSVTANGLSEVSPIHTVSNDGNFTVFISNAPNLVADEVDTSLSQNVYLYNKSAGTVTLLSHAAGAAATTGNGESANAVISGDGKTVLFYSYATDLISSETFSGTAGKDPELYLYDNDPASKTYGQLQLVSHTTTSTTQAANGTLPGSPNGLSGYSTLLYSSSLSAQGLALPSISDDGQYIAYLSNATNLSGSNTGAATLNAFLYDRGADTNTMISHANGVATTANKATDTVAISADGSTVAFTSKATNLLSSSVTTTGDQLYVWSRINNTSVTGLSAGQTMLASHAASSTTTAASFGTGTASSLWGPLPASLSSDGAFVAYYFGGNNLVSGQAGTASPLNVFRYDVAKNTNLLVSHANSSATTAGDNPKNTNLYEAGGPAISTDGRYIAYANNSTNLLSSSLTGQNGQDNVYLFDANQTDVTLQNTLVSHADGSATTPDDHGGTSPSISSDGRYVSFIDLALDNSADVNCTFTATANVRLFDAQASATSQPTKVGAAFDSTPMILVGATLAPTVLSADGSTLAWDGLAAGVISGDLNGNLDVFQSTSATTLTVKASSISTSEGSTFTGKLATLTDSNTADSASSFTATINWGDGKTTTGLVTGSTGTFTITDAGNHVYADEGTPTFNVTIKKGSQQVSDHSTATVSEADTLSVTGVGITPTEGTAFTGKVATFTTTYSGATADDFTATIDWGDGTTTTGVITGSGGNFTVTASGSASHTYADEGSQSVKVTVSDDSPGTASASATTSITVGEGDTLSGSASSISATEGTAFSTAQVATFTTTYTANTADDFTASIDWGDGSSSSATITGSSGSFTIKSVGSHTYADEGSYTFLVTINDDSPGTASLTLKGTATVAEADTLSGSATPISATEGTAFSSVQVATFTTTYTGNTADDFTATIDWGDNTTSSATTTGSNGSFTVKSSGSHTYADEGSYTFTVTIKDDAPGTASLTLKGTATVAEADTLSGSATPIAATEGTAFSNVQVATFSTTYTGNTADDFSATIDWGDGSTGAATITGSSGGFTVKANGSHTYADEGSYSFTVTIKDDAPSTASLTLKGTAIVAEADKLSGSATPLAATEGTALTNVQVATFSTTYTGNTADDFTASIDWGDGSTSAATISGSNGSFTVKANGSHTYADEGSYTVTVTINDDAPGTANLTLKATATVAEADTLTGSATPINATEGTAFSNVQVGTFNSTYTGNTADDFSASIDWGDGTSSAATITGSKGSFTVKANGSHTYADEGSYTFTVTINDDAPGTANLVLKGTATVAEADTLTATATTISPVEGKTLASVQVASFTTTYTNNTAADFAATIDWGDGSTSAGVITGSNGSFVVKTAANDSHAYADEGSVTITVTIADDAPGTAKATAQQTVNVAEGDTLTATATAVSPVEGTPLQGVQVASFTTTYTDNVASDFTATIDWGDGSSSTGVITGGNGSFVVKTAANDNHVYADEGPVTITTTITDDAPGTATAQAIWKVASVGEADVLTVTPIKDTSVAEGTAFTGTVATFTTTYAGNTAGDFSASIDWGDGTVTAGTISGSNGHFTVKAGAGHAYADEGNYTINVTVQDDAPGTATKSAQFTLTASEADTLTGSATLINATEGTAFSNVQVGTFNSTYTGNTAGDFSASIDWGDGSTSAATISGSNGSFTVKANGSHTYADEGSYTVTVAINDDAPGTANLTLKGTATVAEADTLSGSATALAATEGTAFTNVQVGTFNTTYTGNTADDFTASIDWGDGSTSAATITGSKGSFTVKANGSHTYADEGSYTFLVTIKDDAPGTASLILKGTATVAEADVLSATGIVGTVTEGTAFTGTVATFTTTYLGNTKDDFAATIDWGDGTVTAGVITGSAGNYVVGTGALGHAYADEGVYTVLVTIGDDAPGTAGTTAKTTLTVGEADVLSGTVTPISTTEGVSLNGVQVAAFSTSYLANTASDFTATIDWGDGSTSTGQVAGSGGNFTIKGDGNHAYADEGSYSFTVTITDDASGTATLTLQGTATVAEGDTLTGNSTSFNAVAGTAFNNVQVATFTTTQLTNTPSGFTASIDWGDGSTSAGTVSGSDGSFTVAGGHTYSTAGSFDVSVTVTDNTPGSAVVKITSTAQVAAPPVATPAPTPTQNSNSTGDPAQTSTTIRLASQGTGTTDTAAGALGNGTAAGNNSAPTNTTAQNSLPPNSTGNVTPLTAPLGGQGASNPIILTVPPIPQAGAVVAPLTVVAQLGTSQNLTYQLAPGPGGQDNSLFTITGNQLLTTAPLTTVGTYTIRVRITDSSGMVVEQVIQVTVTPGQTAPPESESGADSDFLILDGWTNDLMFSIPEDWWISRRESMSATATADAVPGDGAPSDTDDPSWAESAEEG